MTLHDPLWTSLDRVRERAEEHARKRDVARELASPSGWTRVAGVLGSLLIVLGERIHALGCRLADACACGCAEASAQTGM